MLGERKKHDEAIQFFWTLWSCNIPKICLENPRSTASKWVTKYTQIIHPWQFGHLEQKETWLWLRGLPKLKEENNVYNDMIKLPINKRQRIHYMGGKNKSELRSKTYQGIADAMAKQWG